MWKTLSLLSLPLNDFPIVQSCQRISERSMQHGVATLLRRVQCDAANPASRSLTHVGGVKSVEPPDENKEPRIIIDEERTVNVKRSRTISRDRAAKINATFAENKMFFFLLARIAAFWDASLTVDSLNSVRVRSENRTKGRINMKKHGIGLFRGGKCAI